MTSKKKVTNQELIEILNQAISLLPTQPDKAVALLHPYVPVNGPVTIDYGIYSLQYALIFGESIQETKADENKCMPVKIGSLFEACKIKNSKEYEKLLDWSTKKMKQVQEQISRARINLLMDSALYESLRMLSSINPVVVEKMVLSLQITNPQPHLLANTYKDMYETTHFLEMLANLIIISNGGDFSSNPFKGLTVNGNSLQDKSGNLIKGNAISWLEKKSDKFLKEIIQSSYNNKLRNILGGHNDYIFDNSTETYLSNDGKSKFEYGWVYAYLINLELLFTALWLDSLTRFYEDTKHPSDISDIGYMDWRFNDDKDEVLILQNWSNFSKRKLKKPHLISFYRLPVKRKGKFISLGFDGKYIYPHDLSVIANNYSLELMQSLKSKKDIKVIIVSVVPKVSPFTQLSKADIMLYDREFLVINEIRAVVKIDKPALNTLINYLSG